jgi:hypothetical protein
MDSTASVRSLVLVVIVSVATTVGWRMLADRERSDADERRGTAPEDLAQRIVGLEEGVRELRDVVERSASLAASSAAAAGARAPEALTESADARLQALVAQLADIEANLTALGESLAAGQERAREELAADLKAAIADVLLAAGPRSEPMPDALPENPPDIARLEAMRGLKFSETENLHLLWTYEQVGAQFGRPTSVAPSANGVGIKYFYELPDGTQFCFWFVGGKVVKSFW